MSQPPKSNSDFLTWYNQKVIKWKYNLLGIFLFNQEFVEAQRIKPLKIWPTNATQVQKSDPIWSICLNLRNLVTKSQYNSNYIEFTRIYSNLLQFADIDQMGSELKILTWQELLGQSKMGAALRLGAEGLKICTWHDLIYTHKFYN